MAEWMGIDRRPVADRMSFTRILWHEALITMSTLLDLLYSGQVWLYKIRSINFLTKKLILFFASYIRSSEDISSSGYSSAEPVSMALSRTASLTTNTNRNRPKTRRSEVSSNKISVFLHIFSVFLEGKKSQENFQNQSQDPLQTNIVYKVTKFL